MGDVIWHGPGWAALYLSKAGLCQCWVWDYQGRGSLAVPGSSCHLGNKVERVRDILENSYTGTVRQGQQTFCKGTDHIHIPVKWEVGFLFPTAKMRILIIAHYVHFIHIIPFFDSMSCYVASPGWPQTQRSSCPSAP
jgi:hypothetical protein